MTVPISTNQATAESNHRSPSELTMEILPPLRTDCIANKRCVRRLHGWQRTTSGSQARQEYPYEARQQLGYMSLRLYLNHLIQHVAGVCGQPKCHLCLL